MTLSLECDVLVVGGGAGALTGALTAASAGLDVLLVEKTEYLGGTAAYAGAGLWLPLNSISAADFDDTREEVDAYVAATTDATGYADLRVAYLDAAPKMIEDLLANESLDFVRRPFPDYYPAAEGYKPQGRAIFPKPLPASEIGDLVDLIRPELPLICGGHDTGDQLTGGRALLGRLIQACTRAGVRVELSSPLHELVVEDGAVVGARIGGPDGDRTVTARRGVLLAAGGFDHDIEMRRAEGHPVEDGWQMGAPGGTGEVLAEARRIGADTGLLHEAWWTPVFLTHLGPCFRVHERGYPGSIVVNQDGERFCNESLPYDRIGRAFRSAVLDGSVTLPAWWIVDRPYVEKYGLNGQPPGNDVPAEWLESGFAHVADTLEELAAAIGVPADRLTATVERFNGFAASGVDEDFGRGDNAFDLFFGDPEVTPNPALAPLTAGPYVALPMALGDLGTKGGLRADPHARVLDEAGQPIPGLYAAGNIMASWTGSCYPGPGAPIGSSMVFGYLAATHLVATAAPSQELNGVRGVTSTAPQSVTAGEADPRLADWDTIAGWLREQGVGPETGAPVEVLAGGTQNILIRYVQGGRSLVLRRPPLHPRPGSSAVLRREVRILGALAGTAVPHAALVAACTDENVTGWVFYVMEMVDGFNPAVGLPPHVEASRDLRRDLAFHAMDVLAVMGNQDHHALGLADFGKPDGFLERQVPRWLREWESIRSLEGYEPVELPGLERIVAWLDANRPNGFRPGIMHGDYHLANLIFAADDARVLAVVDWEMATIGDPLLDLGRFLATWPSADEQIGTAGPIYRTDGLPTADELVERYRATSELAVDAVDWYVVLACFKIGVILEGTHARSRAGLADPAVGARLHGMSQALFRRAERIVS